MGQVISMDQRRNARAARMDGHGRVNRAPRGLSQTTTFWFDLASPSTYFAAERAERLFPGLVWRPVVAGPETIDAAKSVRVRDAVLQAAVMRAQELRMPLVWPDGYPVASRAAMRVAAFAADRGQGPAFVLAACRLAFCGGFDLDDPDILAEAAAAAALPPDESLRAADDSAYDAEMEAAGHQLLARGADQLPVLTVGNRLFCGEERLPQAAAVVRDAGARSRRTALDEFAG